ncbi:CbtB domain-containing protein [Pseudooceanicola sp. LIPI14-2-Ac024]|uniref:CbtB domain-containing protein n=1 Tax=Pseudooceanicola sp. LIPI14-2-Ac024 TaxID=3344875 RepID=UPI0035CEBC35
MNASTKATAAPQAASASTTTGIVLAALIGVGIVIFAGHLQASTLHDAAHDVRHATGFPCH